MYICRCCGHGGLGYTGVLNLGLVLEFRYAL